MIAMKFGMPLDEVEEASIVDYRLMLFTVINTAALDSGMGGFKFKTEDEEFDEFEAQLKDFQNLGIFN